MSKCYSKFMYGIAASAAMFVAAGAFAQCDDTTPGDFTDTLFNDQADCNSGNDDNGGWNYSDQFLDAGAYSPGGAFRVVGVVGNFDRFCDTVYNSRDLDWIKFSVSEPCYITVNLFMHDANGDQVDGTNTFSELFIEQGSDSATAIDLYGADDGCPHTAFYTFANSSQQARFPVDTGDILVIVTTPGFTDPLYHGPIPYAVDISVQPYDNASCSANPNDCISTHATGGCSDGACCDLVCGFSPQCCDSAWDATCVQDGVTQCGNFIYNCTDPWIGAANDCVGTAELILNVPAFISFDCSGANTDGPNDVARLCSSSTAHDIWYIYGPTPYAGELLATMCGQGNLGDAVMSMYDLGGTSDIGDPQDLPSKYVACRDDDCDDDGDGNIDVAGPCGINLIGIPAGNYILIRVGAWLDPADPPASDGFAGSMEVSFRAVFVDHGTQSVTNNAGSNTNLGLISGWSTAALPKRWSMIPFDMAVDGTVNGFDFAAFDNATPDQVNWKIVSRSSQASYGDNGRPFGASGNFDAGQVVAEGFEPINMENFANVGDDYQQRFFIDLSSEFPLAIGSYYFTCYGAYADGSEGASFAWLLYGRTSMLQATTASVTIPTGDGASATSEGTFASGTPFGWRGISTGPKMCFYNLGPAYTTQPADDPALLYQCAFNLKGSLAPSCFADLDGSGEVDSGDLGLLLLDFGPCPGCSADLDTSGEVDSGDIGLLLLSFGPCS